MPAPDASLFERSVAVASAGAGNYTASVDPAWSGPAAPNGGVLAATMLRAAQAELGAGAPPPRTIAAHYLEAPQAASVELDVAVLRRGKRVAVAEVNMHQGGRLVCQATIICSAARPQQLELSSTPKRLPTLEELPILSLEEFRGAPPVFHQLDMRPTLGPMVFSGADQAVTGGWMALRADDAPLDPARLCALCDLWWPAIFGALEQPAAVPTLQLTVYLRRVSQLVQGPVLARFRTRQLSEGHLDESGELWSTDGELLAQSHQLALLLPLP